MEILATASNSILFIDQSIVAGLSKVPIFYGSILDANNYFSMKLDAGLWFDSEDTRKSAALFQATQIIDSLNYVGTKVGELEFPRTIEDVEQETVPRSIVEAAYEIAYKLLDGYDADNEIKNLAVSSNGYVVRATYNAVVLDHIRAGVPSALAFTFLRPYLVDKETVNISRVN